MTNSERMNRGLPVQLPIKAKQVKYTDYLETIEDFLLAGEAQILEQFSKLKGAVHRPGLYTFIPGAGSILLVAHVDTVRTGQLLPSEVVFRHGVYSTTGKTPLGADDRAGVYAIHRIINSLRPDELPHILLTDGEESGGYGVREFIADKVLEPIKDDLNLMLEFDRMGADEAVTYSGELPEYIRGYLEERGWRTGHGSYTDIATLIDAYSIPGSNLSVGYYDQHTNRETLVMDYLEMTIKRALGILADPPKGAHTQELRVFMGRYGYSDIDQNWLGHYDARDDSWEAEWDARKDTLKAVTMDDIQWALDTLDPQCQVCMEDWNRCACGNVAESILELLWDDELHLLMEHPKMKDSPVAKDIAEHLTV
ncbi:MAG: M28 family peptidase [Anaerolineales bacterium]